MIEISDKQAQQTTSGTDHGAQLNASAPVAPPPSRLIFLVADDPELTVDMARQLSYFGYRIQVLSPHADHAALAAAAPPAAILIDIAPTSYSSAGAQIIASLQASRSEAAPVLFISTHDDLDARLKAVRAGSHAYLTKPIDIGNLVDQLDMLTSARVSEPYRILVVEDSRQLARYYTAILDRAGMVSAIVTNPLEIMHPLIEFRPDLILMDVYMPGCSGLELARVLRQQDSFLSTPIVFLSAETDLGRQMQAMSIGGDDFLTKPIKPDHLVSALASRAERARVLRSFMIRDSLTGLLNHTTTKDQLDRELARAMRSGKPMSLAMIDIDRFKQVNDTYGHASGDQVLKSLARLLRQRLRKSDTVGRYGGEEFAVILPETDGQAALLALDAIREGFGQLRQRAGEQQFGVSFSCGIAAFPDYADPSQLLNAADRLLYEAKACGRNQVLLASPHGQSLAPRAVSEPRLLR